MGIEKLIKSIRESFVGSEQVYTQGSCYKLYQIVKTQFPEAKAVMLDESHIYIDWGGSYWDIHGKVNDKDTIKNISKFGVELSEHGGLAADWGPFNIYDIHVECPNCDELFLRAELEPDQIQKKNQRKI